MSKVVPFPNRAPTGLNVCRDSVDTIETAFMQIGRLIEKCPDTPSKKLLIQQQQILEVALDHAKTLVAEIVGNLNNRGSNP